MLNLDRLDWCRPIPHLCGSRNFSQPHLLSAASTRHFWLHQSQVPCHRFLVVPLVAGLGHSARHTLPNLLSASERLVCRMLRWPSAVPSLITLRERRR
jgi:hypothetical protein